MRLLASASLSAIAIAATLLTPADADAQRRNRRATATPPAATGPSGPRDITTQLPRNVRPVRYRIQVTPDAANMRFTARTDIDVQVLEATDSITLNAADLEFTRVSLGSLGGGQALALNPRTTRMNEEQQTATMLFARPIGPGLYRLTIDYTGKINRQANGLFALDYPGTNGGQQRALFTQFEAPDARRMFPSWDEPQFRTPYDLSVVVPRGQTGISNMPAASTTPRPDGSSLVTFRTTPAMSSYLLFLGVGEFDRITQRAGNTEIGVVTRRGAGETGRWALTSSARILPWYNNYFGTPFPLPKLDNIAGPGSSSFFGAMENWGAIFSFESILLDDPAISSEGRRQAIFSVAAHEMAHQWFGDLVTMAWWDDLWLNEGFASWMATKATAALHPEWDALLERVDGREAAMGIDAVKTTHPVVRHVETVEQISQAFDAITYQKGEAVIAMLEDYVGEAAWRTGVQNYVRAHRLSNTVSDDLWAAIDRSAGRPVSAIAHDYTLQPGVPLVRVEQSRCVGGRTQVTLRQGEFSRDEPNRASLRWRVPVVASAGGAAQRLLIENGSVNGTVPGCGPLVVNYGQAGYYRTLYGADQLNALSRGFAQLRPIDQSGLMADSWALGLAGYQSSATALDLMDKVPANANPAVWSRAAGIIRNVYGMNRGDAAQQARIAAYASRKLGPVLARLGWQPRDREAPPQALLRTELIATLGSMGNANVVAEANRRFAANDPSVQSGSLRQTILSVVALNANAATWDRLHEMARAERNPLVRQELYGMLSAARDPVLARRTLDLALTDEPGTTISGGMIGGVAGGNPELAFDYALANRERVEALVDASSRSRYFPRIAGGSSDRATIAKLRAYADRYLTPQSRSAADQAIAAIENRAQVREQRLPEINRWFAAHAG
jgi:aminopeptidase N